MVGFLDGIFGLALAGVGFLILLVGLGLLFGVTLISLGFGGLGADVFSVAVMPVIIGLIMFIFGMRMIKKAGRQFHDTTLGLFGIILFISGIATILGGASIGLAFALLPLGMVFMEYGFKFKIINKYIAITPTLAKLI